MKLYSILVISPNGLTRILTDWPESVLTLAPVKKDVPLPKPGLETLLSEEEVPGALADLSRSGQLAVGDKIQLRVFILVEQANPDDKILKNFLDREREHLLERLSPFEKSLLNC